MAAVSPATTSTVAGVTAVETVIAAFSPVTGSTIVHDAPASTSTGDGIGDDAASRQRDRGVETCPGRVGARYVDKHVTTLGRRPANGYLGPSIC